MNYKLVLAVQHQGGYALEGNQARKFLKKVDSLEMSLRKESNVIGVEGLPYILQLSEPLTRLLRLASVWSSPQITRSVFSSSVSFTGNWRSVRLLR